MALLEVKDLVIEYKTEQGLLRAVDGISFSLESGESVGLVGESGCGKSTMAKAMMRLLPDNGEIASGQMLFQGQDLVTISEEEMRQHRLKDIAIVSQSAMNSLNPVYTVGRQIVEGLRAHTSMTRRQAHKRAEEVFGMVGLEAKRLKNFPHQMSGGMKQRAIIAMALSLNPALIIADEPTTALDVVVQDRILQRIVEIQKQVNSSMVFITHDISVVSEICENIIVMYGGKIMEKASSEDFFRSPCHPYSLGLQNAFPSIGEMSEQLISIPGSPPDLTEVQTGCRFKERCPFVQALCHEEAPELAEYKKNHLVACHFCSDVQDFQDAAKRPETWAKVKDRLLQNKGRLS